MTRVPKSVTILDHQETWMKSKTRDQFNFSKFVQEKLEEYIQEESKLNKLKQKLEEDANEKKTNK
jgi:hypothetical protein